MPYAALSCGDFLTHPWQQRAAASQYVWPHLQLFSMPPELVLCAADESHDIYTPRMLAVDNNPLYQILSLVLAIPKLTMPTEDEIKQAKKKEEEETRKQQAEAAKQLLTQSPTVGAGETG
ncbi:hypothetical protein FA95DRAFT_825972 [Auriscalpium vulgare]|uniref:Uncharacterized protein n=1 Tax=Auriscalpium vulgare TaxID=40419 RepID=A0ACB8R9G6_9AGAM|nr:hypothetical protein FA95DRAFT_825972 [Auriscalpium vulgare]